MSLKSGFYNAIETAAGEYDRGYSADEYTNFYSAFLKDGVRRSALDDFKCTAAGLVVTVGAGYAICGAKWIHNDTAYIMPTITPPTAQYSRIDGVFLHVDVNESVRAASLIYREGTPAENPVAPERVEGSGIYELCLCYVNVAANAASVSVVDKRADSAVCGWVTSPVGYDDYFDYFETAFNEYMTAAQNDFDSWFANVRETVATVTLFKQYTQTIETTAAETTTAEINIVQYDPTGVDILQVYCNGMLLIAGDDYTTNGRIITFTVPKIAGTKILIVVYKSIDGTGLGTVADAVDELQTDVAALELGVGELETNLNGLFANQKITSATTYEIAAHQTANPNIGLTVPDGYKPFAFAEIRIVTDASDLAIVGYRFVTSGATTSASLEIVNCGSTTKYYKVYVKVLYIKDLS